MEVPSVTDAIWTPTPEAMTPLWWWKFERQPNGCKLWTGYVNDDGYGRSKGNGPAKGEFYVHRIVYKLLVGPIPDDPELDLDVDHKCHNEDPTCRGLGRFCLHRRCGESEHLRLATHGANKKAAMIDRDGLCKYGHPREGKARCPTCNREAVRRYRDAVVSGQRKPAPSWAAKGYRDHTSDP
jgi:hypothetical protein